MTHGSRKIEKYKDSMNHQNALRVMIMMQMMKMTKMIINIKI